MLLELMLLMMPVWVISLIVVGILWMRGSLTKTQRRAHRTYSPGGRS